MSRILHHISIRKKSLKIPKSEGQSIQVIKEKDKKTNNNLQKINKINKIKNKNEHHEPKFCFS